MITSWQSLTVVHNQITEEDQDRVEHTNLYVNYCLKLVTLLLRHNMDVLLVFDGASLPAKHETNKTRRELVATRRQTMKEKGKLLFEQGFVDKARGCFQQSSEIEFYMIVDIINACKKFPGVRYIVSPYEADAQLAYLSLNDHVQLVISEDSDLIPFGCYSVSVKFKFEILSPTLLFRSLQVLYKMDLNGNGILYERRSLPEALNIPPDKFDFAAFRRMCIMAGCDYLSSLPGIGIRKSAKFFAKTTEQDLTKVLPKIPKYLGMKKVTVTDEYISRFIEAENTFLYQIVFDPVKRKMVPLTPYPNGFTDDSFPYAGKLLAVDVACDLADGNIHPHSHERSETHLIKSTMTATLQSSQSHHAESNRERRNKKFAFEVSGSRSVNKMEPLIQKNEGGRNLKLTSESHKEYLITNKGKFSEICEPAATFVSSYFVSGDASSSSTFLQYVAKEGRDSIPDKADALKNEELDVINEEGNRSFSPSSCWSLLKIEEKKKSSKETLPVLSRNPFKIKSPMTSNSEKQDSCVESNDLPASRLVSVSSIDVLMDDVDADESCSFNSPSPCTAALETACQKQGYVVDNYGLKYRGKLLDTSLTFRFSGLSPNCVLEMAELETALNPHTAPKVEVAVQLPDGSRGQKSFSNDTTLLEILLFFEKERGLKMAEPEDIHFHPVCQYLNSEYIGALQLGTTTLKSLGVCGRALFR
ncbi:unnamed protein product [Soboliphyme baturini]|uniref:Exonuclease 1 n=1 Tax=Soboliphyme baturini TaxID=241478 RepID=A0A183IZK8_9BILA|nr:unnamed protein product [Soboliphyme baturini]